MAWATTAAAPARDLDALAEMRAQPGAPNFVHDLPEPFFRTLEQRMAEVSAREGRSYVFKGNCWTCREAPTLESRNKRSIVELQHDLLAAERLARFPPSCSASRSTRGWTSTRRGSRC